MASLKMPVLFFLVHFMLVLNDTNAGGCSCFKYKLGSNNYEREYAPRHPRPLSGIESSKSKNENLAVASSSRQLPSNVSIDEGYITGETGSKALSIQDWQVATINKDLEPIMKKRAIFKPNDPDLHQLFASLGIENLPPDNPKATTDGFLDTSRSRSKTLDTIREERDVEELYAQFQTIENLSQGRKNMIDEDMFLGQVDSHGKSIVRRPSKGQNFTASKGSRNSIKETKIGSRDSIKETKIGSLDSIKETNIDKGKEKIVEKKPGTGRLSWEDKGKAKMNE